MRMWLVDPRIMCRQHLLGEHLETHMLVGTIKRGHSIEGYVSGGLVEPLLIKERHDALVTEMECRGYNHNSPMESLGEFDLEHYGLGYVSVEQNRYELARRCTECARLQETI